MKNMLRKLLLPAVAVMSLLFVSCDVDDLYIEDDIVGSWSYVYEDDAVFEEEVYDFDPSGRWTSRYIYENIYGEYIYEVDAGTYYVSYGKLQLKSKFTNDNYSFSINIRGNRMILRSGEYYCEFLRFR